MYNIYKHVWGDTKKKQEDNDILAEVVTQNCLACDQFHRNCL